jgi:inorganic triphosphatase YgiF
MEEETEMEIKLRIPPKLHSELRILKDYYKQNKLEGKPTTLADIAFTAIQQYLETNREDLAKAKEYFKKMLE